MTNDIRIQAIGRALYHVGINAGVHDCARILDMLEEQGMLMVPKATQEMERAVRMGHHNAAPPPVQTFARHPSFNPADVVPMVRDSMTGNMRRLTTDEQRVFMTTNGGRFEQPRTEAGLTLGAPRVRQRRRRGEPVADLQRYDRERMSALDEDNEDIQSLMDRDRE